MGRMEGKVGLVTGGATGIGRACALRLAAEGARIAVADIDRAGGEAVAGEIQDKRGEAIFVALDVTREDDWRGAIDQVMAAFGRLDTLVNNAGVAEIVPVEDMTLDSWRRTMAVNLDGVFLGTKHAIGAMARSGGGSIVNISSILGITGIAGAASYCASKGGVRLFTKAAALDCAKAKNGIRVNSVHPGYIHTAMMEDTCRRDYGDIPTGLKELGKLHPIGRVGEPEEIADGVLFLASDESKFVTGTELVIDGGYTAE